MNRILRRNESLVALLIIILSLGIGLINPTFFTVANLSISCAASSSRESSRWAC